MEKFNVAFATDDGSIFINRHFGDADNYYIYKIDNAKEKLLTIIKNTTGEEDVHADPRKAKSINELLSQNDVSVVVSKVFGPNIVRIKKKFVCVKINEDDIQIGINKVWKNINMIADEWDKGSERSFLVL